MEVLSLLKYWRGGGGGSSVSAAAGGARSGVPVTTISSSAGSPATEADDDSGDDDGPFFDLEFAVPVDDSEGARLENDDVRVVERGQRDVDPGEEASDDEREFDLTLTSDANCTELRADPTLVSPSDELFFKGRFVPIDSSSVAFKPSESGSKAQMLPVTLLKTKFRVLLLGSRKQKGPAGVAAAAESDSISVPATAASPKNPSQRQGKPLTVKFKVEDLPILSLFTRDSSSRSDAGVHGRLPKQTADDTGEKKPPKELVQKYLGKIKPLYVRVSKRYGEKSRFSGHLSAEDVVSKQQPEKTEDGAASSPPVELSGGPCSGKAVPKQNHSGVLPTGLRVVYKQFGKSRSASAAVASVPSPPAAVPRRRDDSLLQLQDGIQSAIAHCKMSLSVSIEPNAPTACGEKAQEDLV